MVTWLVIRMRTEGALYLELFFFFELADFIDFEAKYTVMYAVLPRHRITNSILP